MWIDDIIRKAIEEGQFDNLPGHGRPLNLHEDSHTPYELRGAYRIMRQAGATLPWIGQRKQIEADIEEARQFLRRAWQWYTKQGNTRQAQERWRADQLQFQQMVKALNRRIRDYNLIAPHPQVHLYMLDFEHELQRVQ